MKYNMNATFNELLCNLHYFSCAIKHSISYDIANDFGINIIKSYLLFLMKIIFEIIEIPLENEM